jgi:nucleotide-binding universal stress UspA family protein
MCLDGKPREKKLVREAIRIVKALDARLTVLHVNDPEAGQAHFMMDSLRRTYKDELIAMIQDADTDCVLEDDSFEVLLIDHESYSDAILEASRNQDLLIMGHNKHRKFLGAVINSTDEQVADRVDCPILLVPLS